MKLISKLTVLAVIVVCFYSCKNSTSELLIPKDASFVLHISGSSLTSKLSWDEIKKSSWFQEAMSKHSTDSTTKSLLDNPDNSGVDIKSSFAFFAKNQGIGGYSAFEGNIKDATAFENTVSKMHPNAKVQTDGDIKYITNEKNVLTWSKSKFIFLSNAPYLNSSRLYDQQSNSYPGGFSTDSLRLFGKQLYDLKSSDQIESDDHFKDMMKESGDIHFWFNSDMYSNNMAGGMMSMMKMSNLFQGNVATGALSFDDGKITMKWKQYYGKEMKAILDKYTFKNVTEDMVNRVPSQNVLGIMVGNFPPDVLKEFLRASGMDGMANGMLSKFNFSLDELISSMKGQVIIAVTDFSQTPVTISTGPDSKRTLPMKKTNMNVLFALGVNNKASFDKLMGIVKENIHDTSFWSKVNYKVDNDWFVVSNKPEPVAGFFGNTNTKQPFASKITGHPFGAYVDLQKISDGIASDSDSTSAQELAVSKAMWQDVVMTGGDYKDGVVTADMTVNLVDKSTNSLKQMNHYMDQMHSLKKKGPQPQYMQTDSTASIIPSGGDLPSSTGR
jgi:hypothetical protein